ncbi:MAG: TIGR01458 family HAD-type hydrolase [Actinomycetota bacterium]
MSVVEGLLLDIDGVFTVSWEALPGAISTFRWLRSQGPPFRMITNTTTDTRADLAAKLARAGLDVAPEEIVTAVVATAGYLRAHHHGARVLLLSDGDARADLEEVNLVDERPDVVLLGGAYEGFSYATVNRVFRMLMDGAELIAMHRNLYWRTTDGWQLDSGAYIAGLEEATGRRAVVCGKPAAAYFESALATIGVEPSHAAMVGDDVASDVVAAQSIGMTGVLVRTGKFRPEDLLGAPGWPDHAIDSVAELPELLRTICEH